MKFNMEISENIVGTPKLHIFRISDSKTDGVIFLVNNYLESLKKVLESFE